MNQYHYSLDGKTGLGPITRKELRYLLADKIVGPETLVFKVGETDWKKIRAIEELDPPYRPRRKGEDVPISPERVLDSHEILSALRSNLDRFWEAQREAIVAAITEDDLDEEYETLRKPKQKNELIEQITEQCLAYWRKSGQIESWISSMLWKDHDFTLPLSGDEDERFEQIKNFLTGKQIHDYEGCYIFSKGDEYLYVGETDKLLKRAKDHKAKSFVLAADAYRVMIPKKAPQRKQMERLLTLALAPKECRVTSWTRTAKNNPADEIITLVQEEIRELQTNATD